MSPAGPRRTLLLSAFAPALGNGRSLRTYTILRALARMGPVDVVYKPFGGPRPSPEHDAIEGVSYHALRPSGARRRLAGYAGLRARRVPSGTARAASPELAHAAAWFADAPDRGLIVASDLPSMVACLGVAADRPIVYVAHNVQSSYEAGSGGSGGREPMRRMERRVFSAADESWMVSRRDVAMARELVPGGRYRYVPNVVDVDAIHPAAPTDGPRRRILMVGDFAYPPNADGAAWLIEQVMPRVRRLLPDAHVTLVGREGARTAPAEPGVETPGFVEDLEACYDRADVVAVPLLEGGGSPLKFVEALAFGLPVVATPVAAQGLELEAGRHYRLAADAERFAAELVTSLTSDDRAMAAEARAFVRREYSIDTLTRILAGAA